MGFAIKVCVVDGLNNDVLLGRDFPEKHEVNIDFSKGTVTVRERGVQTTVPIKDRSSDRNESLYIQANMEIENSSGNEENSIIICECEKDDLTRCARDSLCTCNIEAQIKTCGTTTKHMKKSEKRQPV